MGDQIYRTSQDLEKLQAYASSFKGFCILSGLNGTGKTYTARKLYNLYPSEDTDLKKFITLSTLFRTWKTQMAEWDNDNYLYQQYLRLEFLVLDDFGVAPPTPGFLNFLYDIINDRDERRDQVGTVITTNLTSDEVARDFGSRFSSRMNSGIKFRWSGFDRRNSPESEWLK